MSLRRVAWRRELLLLCIVTMDALWLTPWAALLAGGANPARAVPGPAILALLLVALCSARALGHSSIPIGAQQVLCGALAIVSGVALSGLFLYARYPFVEFGWLLAIARDLGSPAGTGPVVLLGLALYIWWRGISLARNRLEGDAVGQYFRAGILAWLLFHLVGMVQEAAQATSSLLLYFALGLLAVGLAQAEDARRDRGAIRSPFAGSWFLIMAGAALTLVGLATAATLGVWGSAGTLFGLIAAPLNDILGRLLLALLQFMGLVLGPALEALLRWLQGLLAPAGEALGRMPTPMPLPTPAPVEPPGPTPMALQVGFWAIVILGFLALVALVVARLQQRRPAPEAGPGPEATSEAVPAGLGQGLGTALERLRSRLGAALGALRPGSYSLATVREIYASLQRFAAWKGVARAEAQTPYEYERRLDGAWPEAGPEVDAITNAYVRAHYGQRSINAEELQALRAAWERLRGSLDGGPKA